MRRPLHIAFSAVAWPLGFLHFTLCAVLLVTLGAVFGQRRIDGLLRFCARNVVRIAGARLRVRLAPGYDPRRTYLFVSNHVNLFDPFTLCAALPQFARGLELESHFDVPVYGWFMRRFGNVPIPDGRSAEGLRRAYRMTEDALAHGTSLIVFPEGTRTRDGTVGPFQLGGFRMARQFATPIVPVTMVGAFELHHKGRRVLRPGTVTVHVHEPVDPTGLSRRELEALRDRVREIVAAPLDAG